MSRFALSILAVILCAMPAWAHDADVIYVLAEEQQPGSLNETVTLTTPSLLTLAPLDVNGDTEVTQAELEGRADSLRAGVWEQMPLTSNGAPCTRGSETARLQEGFIELAAQFTCAPGELRQDFRILSVLPRNYRVVLGSQFDGERNRTFAQGAMTTLTLAQPANATFSTRLLAPSLQEGLARCFTLDALAGVFIAFFALKSWQRVTLALLIGTLFCAFRGYEPWPSVLILLGAASVLITKQFKGEALLFGVPLVTAGLTLRSGGGAPIEIAGAWLGTVLGLTLTGTPAALVGRILARRPRALRLILFALGLAMLFSFGFRLAA